MGVKQKLQYQVDLPTSHHYMWSFLFKKIGFRLVLKQRSPVCQVKQSNFNEERDRLLSGLFVSVRRHGDHPEGMA
jgi:hypothetical protein